MTSMEDRVTILETHVQHIDQSLVQINNRLDRMDAKIDSNLKWIIGVVLGTWITTIGAIIGTTIAS